MRRHATNWFRNSPKQKTRSNKVSFERQQGSKASLDRMTRRVSLPARVGEAQLPVELDALRDMVGHDDMEPVVRGFRPRVM